MFEDRYPAVVEDHLDRQWRDSLDNELTEDQAVQALLYEARAAAISDLTDAETLTELIGVEAVLAAGNARRARLIAHLALACPASADRPAGTPGAAAHPAQGNDADVDEPEVAEVLAVSEWMSHELQMAHPYSRTAVLDLIDTSLALTGPLAATLELLADGRIDYPRARVLADLLSTCTQATAQAVQAIVLPKAPGLTPGGLATAVRRALAKLEARALRRRHARARRAADVQYWATQDGMARLVADLPLPVAAACSDAIDRYAHTQHTELGDDRPIGQIRTEILTDLILRPWDTTRPTVTGQVTIHLTIPTTPATPDTAATAGGGRTGPAAGLEEGKAEAEVDGQIITAAQCRELLGQLHTSQLYLALHHPTGGLAAVATPAQLRSAGRRRGLRPPRGTDAYRPTCEQDRYVRTRDRSCRHFGCTRKAIHADIDHHHPHPDGPTAVCNLCCYCRTHHRLKHQAPGWTRHFHPDGTLTITTPTGLSRTTRPPGPEPWSAPVPATQPQPMTTTIQPTPTIDDPPPF